MLQIEYLPVTALKPYEKNARRHETKDVNAIANSIKEFGFNDPIGIWGKDNVVVEGHGRLLAAITLGMEEIPCIRLDELTDEQRRAYAIAHNKTAEVSFWDNAILGDELKDLDGLFDMTDFGFSDFEVTILTEDFKPEGYDEDLANAYSNGTGNITMKKRVIITYNEGEEELVKELLNVNGELKVVYTLSELKEI